MNHTTPRVEFSAQSHVVRWPDGFDLTVQVRDFHASVSDEGQLIALAWIHLTRSLQRRGWDVATMVRNLPRTGALLVGPDS